MKLVCISGLLYMYVYLVYIVTITKQRMLVLIIIILSEKYNLEVKFMGYYIVRRFNLSVRPNSLDLSLSHFIVKFGSHSYW